LLNLLEEGELNRGLLMEKLGLHDRKSFRKNYLQPALEQGLIEMTLPDSPKSPTQKYRLTGKGWAVVKDEGS
jgi:ATP-dependent DNA helicase RecG